jgi:hypothetical protein
MPNVIVVEQGVRLIYLLAMKKICWVLVVAAFQHLVQTSSTAAEKPKQCDFHGFLDAIVKQYPPVKKHNTFIALKSGDNIVNVIWLEHRSMFISGHPVEGKFDCRWPSVNASHWLDLTKDVVENEKDVEGSTYLVTKDWVGKLLTQAVLEGRFIYVEK